MVPNTFLVSSIGIEFRANRLGFKTETYDTFCLCHLLPLLPFASVALFGMIKLFNKGGVFGSCQSKP